MASASQSGPKRVELSPAPSASETRHPSLNILFVHSRIAEVERCLQELKRVQFVVSADLVVTPEQFAEHLTSKCYDLILAEYPSPNWHESQALELLYQSKRHIPLIFVGKSLQRETVADFITKGAYDCIEMDHIGHLPVAIRRALDEKKLRDERDRAQMGLRHSEARYRALAGNLSYGICRCNTDGKFLDVNEALVTMLGYVSKEELLPVNLVRDVILDPDKRAQLLGQSGEEGLVDPVETEWKRKDHTTVRVRLSGQEEISEHGKPFAYEIIAEDVTKQRRLEDRLRREAASDSLTGLANYRRLVEVLDMEINRSERTGREFALLLFDLDGLKLINDREGHMTGSQALCRVADVLFFCREIDTPARYGGDEFALVLPETGAEAANMVALRICDSIANDGKGPPLSVSVGVAIFPEDGNRIDTLLRAADVAMYSMKRQKKQPA